MVGLTGLGPVTSRLSGVRSNQLSYRPETNLKGQYPQNQILNSNECASTIEPLLHINGIFFVMSSGCCVGRDHSLAFLAILDIPRICSFLFHRISIAALATIQFSIERR